MSAPGRWGRAALGCSASWPRAWAAGARASRALVVGGAVLGAPLLGLAPAHAQAPAPSAPAVPAPAGPVVPAAAAPAVPSAAPAAGPSAPVVPGPSAPASVPVAGARAPDAPVVAGPAEAATGAKVAGPSLPTASADASAPASAPAPAPADAGAAPPGGDVRDPLEDRLLGADPSEGEGAPAPRAAPFSLPTPTWAVALAVGLVFAFVIGKLIERRRQAAAPAGLRVLSTTALGRDGSLSVVELRDAEGGARRLLIGHGGGAPRLVIELSAGDEFEARLERAEAPARAADARAADARAADARAPEGRAQAPALRPPAAPARAADPPSRLTDEGRSRPGGPRALAPRKDLIAEVLAERTDDDDSTPPDEPQDRPSGAYTFRGLLG